MYQGGKTRIAAQITQQLELLSSDRGVYVEPFVGSAAVFHKMAPRFEVAVGADIMEDLVLLWQAAADGWIPPENLSMEEHQALWHSSPSALRAFAGFPCSFGGRWFQGYARDPKSDRNFAQAGSRSIVRRAKTMKHAEFRHADYHELEDLIGPKTLVYADPPYANTKSYPGSARFDSKEFWATMARWVDKGAQVAVSEYVAPPEWVEVWSVDRHVSTALDNSKARATDKLFVSK